MKTKLLLISLWLSALCFSSFTTFSQPFSISVSGPTQYCISGQTSLSVTPAGGISFRWFAYPAYPFGLHYTTGPVFFSPPTGMWICEVTTGTGVYTTNVVMIQTIDPYITAPVGTTACSPSGVMLQDNASSIYAMPMYNSFQWRKDGVNIAGATGYTHLATSSGIYTLSISIGCGTAVSNPITVTVSNSIPAGTSITPGGPTTFCTGGNVNLTVPAIANSYQWKRNAVNISGATSSSYNATLAGTYTCLMSNDCGSFTTAGVVVVVNAFPSASITAGGPTSFCTGGSVVLSANSGAGLTYQWKRDGSSILGANAINYTATIGGFYTVTTTSNGCSTTSTAVVVTVNSIPVVSFTGLAASYICMSPAVTLSGSPSGGTFSGPGVSGTTFNPSALAVGGPYTITYSYTNASGCSNSASGNTSVTSGFNCLIPQNVTVTGVTATTVTFTWQNSSANSFQVRYKKPTSSVYTVKTFTASACQNTYTLTRLKKNTTYELSLRSNCSSGPSAYSTPVTFTTAPLRLSSGEVLETRFYPNPVNSQVTVETHFEQTGAPVEFKIFDMIGKLVFTSVSEYENEINLDVSNLEKGVYILQFSYGEEKLIHRMIKE